jgi:hypothetical protein
VSDQACRDGRVPQSSRHPAGDQTEFFIGHAGRAIDCQHYREFDVIHADVKGVCQEAVNDRFMWLRKWRRLGDASLKAVPVQSPLPTV